jgi:hypothetical protein
VSILRKRFVLAGAVALLAIPAPAFACAACFGASDSPLAQGMNWGIAVLLGVIGCVLGTITAFFVFIARKSAALQSEATPDLQPVNFQ